MLHTIEGLTHDTKINLLMNYCCFAVILIFNQGKYHMAGYSYEAGGRTFIMNLVGLHSIRMTKYSVIPMLSVADKYLC